MSELETAAESTPPSPPRGPNPAGRAHMHADDLRQLASRQPKPPAAPVTGPELKAAKQRWQAARSEHQAAMEECIKWMDKTRETADAMVAAELAYGRASLGYRETKA